MNKTIILIVLLAGLLGGSWVILSTGGQESSAPGEAQIPPDTPAGNMNGMPEATVPQGEAVDQLTRSDQGGGSVNISATFITPEILKKDPSLPKPKYDPAKEMVFLIAMNTHSVDLLGYNMAEMTVLLDGGENEIKPIGTWQTVSDGGHHRSGYLVFSRRDDLDLAGQTGSLELLVKDVAQIPQRRLVWELPLPSN